MNSNRPAIIAIGTANPQYVKLQLETAKLIATSLELAPAQRRLLISIYRATGIDKRYSVLSDYSKQAGELETFPNNSVDTFPSTAQRMQIYKDNALGLSIQAIQDCIGQLENFSEKNITHLITVSCTGMYAPGIDIEIVQQFGLKTNTKRTCINFMGCYGVVNALKVADSICRSDSDATVLIVSVELCTIHFQKSMDLDNILANALFADGAAAVLVQSDPVTKKYLALESFHNDLLPQTQKEMAWHIGDSGFDIRLSSFIPEIIETGIEHFIQRLLAVTDNIDFYAIHPGGLKILEACERALGITKDDNKYSYQVLRDYGNMSSATLLFVLKSIWNDINEESSDKNILGCAFGPGLTLEALLLKTYCVN
jgi:alpha-pyrone synthase